MDNLQNNQMVLKISKISILSIILLSVGGILYMAIFIITASSFISKDKEPLLMVAPLTLWICAFTLGIIDICKKERIKIVSIITVAMSGVPLALFLILLLIMLMF